MIAFALPSRAQRGFTLVEISVVLIVIGLILGAVTIGRNLYQAAQMQRISSDFVQGWALAYDAYLMQTGNVPGDTPGDPTGRINGNLTPLCGDALRTAMQAAGIGMPTGRSAGREDRYVYQDANGNPQEIQVCLQNVTWNEADSTPGDFLPRGRNVLTLTGLTPSLASHLDQYLDGVVDASFGRLRENSQAGADQPQSSPWSETDRSGMGNAGLGQDESQVVTLTAWLLMTR